MWISTLVLAPLGAFLTYKANNDSVEFNIDAYKAFFYKVFAIRIKRHLFRKEVIIEDADDARVLTDLDELCAECEA